MGELLRLWTRFFSHGFCSFLPRCVCYPLAVACSDERVRVDLYQHEAKKLTALLRLCNVVALSVVNSWTGQAFAPPEK